VKVGETFFLEPEPKSVFKLIEVQQDSAVIQISTGGKITI